MSGGLYLPDDPPEATQQPVQRRPATSNEPIKVLHKLMNPCYTGFWFAIGVALAALLGWLVCMLLLFIAAGIGKVLTR